MKFVNTDSRFQFSPTFSQQPNTAKDNWLNFLNRITIYWKEEEAAERKMETNLK